MPPSPPARLCGAALLGLGASFVLQEALVLLDQPGPTQMTAKAQRGAEVWHDHNCQACHQLYGYGGFLGPDLTNFVTRQPAHRTVLEAFVVAGPGAMPTFAIPSADLDALDAFLQAMDSTGRGQAQGPPGVHDPTAIVASLPWWEFR